MTSQIKTAIFLGLLTALFIFLGGYLGGQTGLFIALIFSLLMNVGSYWYSDKIVLSMYKAKPLGPGESPLLDSIVTELAESAHLPKPRLYLIPEQAPNAFATGRNPEHAVIAVTQGLIHLLSTEEIRGVLAHEMGHIANRDILLQSIATVLGSAIVAIANIMQWTAFFGRRNENGPSVITTLLMAFLAPLASMLLIMAISRSREYLADAKGASLSKNPLALAGALQNLSTFNNQIPMRKNPATEGLFIVAPLFGGVAGLFSTHPPIPMRIARLKEMAQSGGY